jgi:hypothetical protein
VVVVVAVFDDGRDGFYDDLTETKNVLWANVFLLGDTVSI